MDEYCYKLLSRIFSDGLHYGGSMIGFGSLISEMDTSDKIAIVTLGGAVYLIGSLVQNNNEIANNAILEELRGKDSNLEQTARGETARVMIGEQLD